MKKLILGAAQFGLPYGITNSKGLMPDDKELHDILDYAYERGIQTIDTADAYGIANERLALYFKKSKSRFNIINKIFRYPVLDELSIKNLINNLLIRRDAFKIERFECLMIHHALSLLHQPVVTQTFFSSLKDKGIFENLGLSINNQSEYTSINEYFKIDVLQAPFNIINQNILNTEFITNLHKSLCKIHARSLFLQGILLVPYSNLPFHLKSLAPYLNKVEILAKNWGESVMTMCFLFALRSNYVDKFVFGVQSKKELIEIIYSYNRACEINKKHGNGINFDQFNCTDTNLVDPTNWEDLKKTFSQDLV